MRLTADQELRREFLLFALSKQPDVEAAIDMASRMEQFVCHGRQQNNGMNNQATLAAGTANGHCSLPLAAAAVTGQGEPPDAASEEAVGEEAVKGRKRRWSEADDHLFKQLWQSDRSLEEIASEIDRTVPSLYSRARALGLSKRNPERAQQGQQAAGIVAKDRGQEAVGKGGGDQDGPTQSEGPRAATKAKSQAQAARTSSKARPVEAKSSTSRIAASGGAKRAEKARRSLGGFRRDASKGKPLQSGAPGIFVDPIVQFLRSRDYSVVRVGEGQFRLDGRRTMNAEELRQKANQVRASLGQPPFASQLGEPVG